MEKKNSEKFFRFSDNCIWIRSGKFSQSWTQYLSSTVNRLTKSRKISPSTRLNIFQIKFFKNNEKSRKKRCDGDFASIWDAFTCWVSKRALKGRLLDSVLNKLFRVANFGNTLAMTIIFSIKMFNIWCRLQKWNKKLRKSFLFFR